MQIFKHEHPANIISRIFMLEYMREIGAEVLYKKANKHQKEKFFYKFTNAKFEEKVDLNYEALLFTTTLFEVEKFMKLFMDEVTAIEASREKIYSAAREEKLEERAAEPVEINVMDMAQTEIKKNNSGKLII
jgi:hypothetical protein